MERFLKYFFLTLLGIFVLGFGFAWWLIKGGEWIGARTEQVVTDITGLLFSIGGEFDLDFSLDPS